MLVLTRKAQQQVRIGDNVVVTILRIKGNAVRIGIDAPKSVRVVRAELPKLPEQAQVVEIAAGKPVSAKEVTLAAPQGEVEHTSFEVQIVGDDQEEGTYILAGGTGHGQANPLADKSMSAGLARRVAMLRNRVVESSPLPAACDGNVPFEFGSAVALQD